MVTLNLVYGLACAAAFGAGALAVNRLLRHPLGDFASRMLVGASAGVGLAAGLAG